MIRDKMKFYDQMQENISGAIATLETLGQSLGPEAMELVKEEQTRLLFVKVHLPRKTEHTCYRIHPDSAPAERCGGVLYELRTGAIYECSDCGAFIRAREHEEAPQ